MCSVAHSLASIALRSFSRPDSLVASSAAEERKDRGALQEGELPAKTWYSLKRTTARAIAVSSFTSSTAVLHMHSGLRTVR
jgi:hypothetical protein